MADETKKPQENPIIDMIFRLACVYLAATFFFKGLEDWRNSEYLLVGVDFSVVFLELGLIFSWYKQKVMRILLGLCAALCFIFLILSKLS
ncbi:MAG: hypothetical protein AAB336_07150 [Acidobacteriota bacterium]